MEILEIVLMALILTAYADCKLHDSLHTTKQARIKIMGNPSSAAQRIATPLNSTLAARQKINNEKAAARKQKALNLIKLGE